MYLDKKERESERERDAYMKVIAAQPEKKALHICIHFSELVINDTAQHASRQFSSFRTTP
jgi:uncharacterized protein HemY